MEEKIFATLEECLAFMSAFELMNMPAPDWAIAQKEAFIAAKNAQAVVKNSDTPIWDTLKANYPYGVIPKEKVQCVENTVNQLLEEGPHAEEPGLLLGKIQC